MNNLFRTYLNEKMHYYSIVCDDKLLPNLFHVAKKKTLTQAPHKDSLKEKRQNY